MSVWAIEAAPAITFFHGSEDSRPDIVINTMAISDSYTVLAPSTDIAVDESTTEIIAAGMGAAGIIRALRTLELVRACGPLEEFAMATDDHGITIEFSKPHT